MSLCNEEFVFNWKIENYSFCDCRNGQSLRSPTFLLKKIYDAKWVMDLYPRGYNSVNFISFELLIDSERRVLEQPNINFEIKLSNSKDEVFVSVVRNGKQFVRGVYCSIENVISVVDLEREIEESGEDTLNVQCRFTFQNSDQTEFSSKSKCTANTEISFDTVSFLWKVYFIPFTRPTSSNTWFPTWHSTLSEKKTFSLNNDTHLCVSLTSPQDEILFEIVHVSKKKTPFLRVKCEIILLSKEGVNKNSSCHFFTFDEKNSRWNFPPFLKKSSLDKETLDNGNLNLKFNFKFSNGNGFKKIIDEAENSNSSIVPATSNGVLAINYLSDDLRAMLLNEKHTDVSFRIDDEIISAHKCILASRSPVFSAMFDQNMVENQTGMVEISDMDAQTLRLFLEFLYTEDIEISNWDKALGLMLAADKYQVSTLKDKCSEFLKNSLSADNICEVVSTADLVGQELLKTAAVDYIKKNSTEILDSPKWLEWVKKNVELCSEILYSLSQEFKTLQKKK